MRFSLAVITPMIGGIPEPTDLVMTASRVPPQAAEIAAMWLYRPNQKRTVVVAVMVAYKRGCSVQKTKVFSSCGFDPTLLHVKGEGYKGESSQEKV
ncbi:hypothetical protein Hdeb2414_s0010g00335651 [Helianthus debilis subsp. tardiflorus]